MLYSYKLGKFLAHVSYDICFLRENFSIDFVSVRMFLKKKMSHSVGDVLDIVNHGGMFVLVDDVERENEADLVIGAQFVQSKHVTFMAKRGSGLICVALQKVDADRFGLEPISYSSKTRFSLPVEASSQISTGISSKDRARTISVLSNLLSTKEHISIPGHVHTLIAREGGIMRRPGHTESSLEIARLSNINPSTVICEIIKENGQMLCGGDVFDFSKEYDLPLIRVADVLFFSMKRQSFIERVYKEGFFIKSWDMNLYCYKDKYSGDFFYVFFSKNASLSKDTFYISCIKENRIENIFIYANTLIRDMNKKAGSLYPLFFFYTTVGSQKYFIPSSICCNYRLCFAISSILRDIGFYRVALQKELDFLPEFQSF